MTFTGAQVRAALEKQGRLERLAASKRARVVRERGEFDVRDLQSIVRAPFIPPAAYSWSIEQIVQARDAQMAGRFRLPARLAESFGTDDALFTARGVRLAPVQSLDVVIEAGPKARGDSIASEAEALFGNEGIAISSDTVTTLRQQLTDHGIAFGYNDWQARGDGSRIDVVHKAWPIEFVWWNPVANCFYTQIRHLDDDPEPQPGGAIYQPTISAGMQPLEPIIHGDGRWVVYTKTEILPHRFDATLLAAALVWARHAFGMRDWSKGSAAHGNAKVVGELPPETPLSDAEGKLTAEASAFLALVQAVASQDSPAGIRPSGSKIDYVMNTSQAWEVWAKLAETAERAAARIYLGTDGVLGAQGGAPGVDISALFGVATSKVQSDLRCIERGGQTGVISPWAAINFGDDKLAPKRKYVFPDPDQSRVRDDFGKRNAAFLAALKAAKDAGATLTDDYVNKLAESYGVPAPTLAVSSPTTPSTDAPADDAAPTPSDAPAQEQPAPAA